MPLEVVLCGPRFADLLLSSLARVRAKMRSSHTHLYSTTQQMHEEQARRSKQMGPSGGVWGAKSRHILRQELQMGVVAGTNRPSPNTMVQSSHVLDADCSLCEHNTFAATKDGALDVASTRQHSYSTMLNSGQCVNELPPVRSQSRGSQNMHL